MGKILISIIVAFAAGFFASRKLIKNPEPVPAADCSTLTEAKSDLIALSKNEYLEYTQIKDLKQKYEKADELLGKIMLLFLADVGFRAQKSPEPVLAAPTTPVTATPEVQPKSSPPPAEIVQESPKPQMPVSTDLAGKSAQIRSLRSEEKILAVLNQTVIENPKIESAKGNPLNPRQLRELQGVYIGRVHFFDPKRGELSVTWNLDADLQKRGPVGTFRLSIHGPSRNSETNSNGHIDNFSSLAEDPNGYLVYACGGDCYFQLYYNAAAEQFYGNYYETSKASSKKFDRLGYVDLKK